MDQTFLWNATTLEGAASCGVIRCRSKKEAMNKLQAQGYFKISLDLVPRERLKTILSPSELITILNALSSILDAGISMLEALELLVNDRHSPVIQYVFLKLRKTLHDGHSLEEGFSGLSPLFSDFFVAMIRLSERSGNFRQGLHDLRFYYQQQENRRLELQRIFRYPKIVFSMIAVMSLGIIIFVVPMFNNVYALFKDGLPFLTSVVVRLSRFFHEHAEIVLAICGIIIFWAYLPGIRVFHPWLFLRRKIRTVIQSKEDPFLFAHAMSLLLASGQSVHLAAQQATDCLSPENRKYGQQLSQRLNAGLGFSEAFQATSWFPDVFRRFIAPAEQTGLLQIGFEQVHVFIDRQRSSRFEKWSRLIEPALMLLMGSVTMILLLSIYLPIFDLGNRIG